MSTMTTVTVPITPATATSMIEMGVLGLTLPVGEEHSQSEYRTLHA